MHIFENLSIKYKLILLSMLTTGSVLLLCSIALVINEFFSFRRFMIDDLTVQARIIADNSTAALSFDDPEGAKEVLSALGSATNVVYAVIYTQNGEVCATFKRGDAEEEFILPPVPQSDGYRIGAKHLDVFQQVNLKDKTIGTVYIRSDLGKLYNSLIWYTGVVILVIVGSFGVGFLMISKLQKTFTKPILSLREATRKVAYGNFAVKAEVISKDEIGWLTSDFNKMTEELHIKDITMRESEAKYRMLVNNAGTPIISCSIDGKIILINSVGAKNLGGSPNDFIGKSIYEVLPDIADHTGERIRKIIETGIGNNFEDEVRLPSGNFWFNSNFQPMKDVSGKVFSLQIISQDITERKKIEKQIKASLKEKEMLLNEIHHRVKNNLQIISSLLDMSSMRAQNQETIDLFRDSRNRVESMALIHSQLYTSERFDEIDMEQHLKKLSRNLLNVYSKEKTITLDIKSANVYLPVIQAVPCALVLNELISNSLKHAYRDRQQEIISISMQESNDNTILAKVKDNGIGIPEEIDLERTRSLGLRLARNIVYKQLNGKIKIVRNKGTEVIIEFRNSREKT